jgi:hypothetical protein
LPAGPQAAASVANQSASSTSSSSSSTSKPPQASSVGSGATRTAGKRCADKAAKTDRDDWGHFRWAQQHHQQQQQLLPMQKTDCITDVDYYQNLQQQQQQTESQQLLSKCLRSRHVRCALSWGTTHAGLHSLKPSQLLTATNLVCKMQAASSCLIQCL